MTEPKTQNFKVGDLVSCTGFPPDKAQIMVVEQVCARGRLTHYLCSYVDKVWMPSFFAHDFLRKHND